MSELTDKQRAQISRMRYQGYTAEKIAETLGVTAKQVRSTERRGRPKSVELTQDEHARMHLLTALAKQSQTERYRAVRCVLANFGPELGYTMADTRRVIEEWKPV